MKKEYQDVELTGGFLEKRLKATQDIYSNFFFNTVTSLSGPQALAKRASYSPPHLFDEVTEMIRPLYNEVAIQTHDLIHDETADGSFQWEWVRESAQIKLKNSPAATFRLESSDVPVLQLPNKFGWWLGLVAIALLYFIGVYLLLRFVAMKVFLLDLLLPTVVGRSDSDLNEVTENTIVLGMPHTGKTELVDRPEFHFVDIRRIVATEEWEEALKEEVPRDKKVIAIDHLEYDMDDRECNGQKLRLLEKFLFANRILLVSSTTDPMDFSISAPQREARKEENESGGEKAREEEQEHRASLFMDRWAAVWSTFNRKVYTAKDPARQEDLEAAISESGLSLQIGKILLGECRVTGRLRRIGIEIAGLKLEGEVSEEEMIVDVLDRARAYYRALWATCSREEKLALIHFAEDGFANVEVSSLRRLVERGLLVRRPHLRPMNESFRHFVIELGRTDGVTPLADEKWHPKAAIRGTLVTAMIGTALILFLTQPHLLNLSTTFIGAAGAAIPALLKLFDLISEARTRK